MDKHSHSKRSHSSSSSSTSKHKSHKDNYGEHSRDFKRHRQRETHDESSFEHFDYSRHKYVLNRMFFATHEKVRIGTKEHEDFWQFLRRYQSMRANVAKGEANKSEFKKSMPANVTIPDEWSDIEVLMATKGCIIDEYDYTRDRLSKDRICEFRNIAVLYLDFLEKQRAKALEKLKQMQKELPIYQFKDDILAALKSHSVILIAGDTGCGKSTQVPQYLLYDGYSRIACTQPRRIACISLRKRVAYETLNEFGTDVGYQIRFDKQKTKHTKILFLTEGLLLRQVVSDPTLANYDVIVLDEVHERHLSCDFLLGIAKCLIHQRKDNLKIILMSATINVELFSSYFGNCPVIMVPGRLFPIQVHYHPIPKEELSASKGSRINPAPYLRLIKLIDDKYPMNERGDLLIFLSGLTEISSVADSLRIYAQQTQRWIILLLHSTLSIEEQDKVFDVAPEGVRKCILSTNIAETSVTIDGIRFVVDSGKVKEMSYTSPSQDSDTGKGNVSNVTCRIQRLQEFWISRASAEQRKGRAGRTGPGVCYRLFSERDFQALEAYSTPEIKRVPLDSLLLQMIAMGLPDARKFPFLEPPSAKSIEEALQSLKERGALTNRELLTPMGKMLSRLPIDITIGKMLIFGSVFSLTEPILSLAACLSVQSPFTNQSYRDSDMIAARRPFQSDHGDPFTLLNTYNKWLQTKADERFDSRKWCKRRGLEEQRFYEITKLRRQFKDLLKDAGLLEQISDDAAEGTSAERIHRHGELMHLKKVKRNYERSAPRRRKLLKLDFDGEISDDNEIDVKDVDFRLSHDRRQVEALQSASRAYTEKDIILMKLILTSGLHPQFAIADEHNSYKIDSDQMFHTKGKPFVVLHPNGIFATEPDILKPPRAEHVKGHHSFAPLNKKHQLIAYVSLLETTKPYLCNCIRVPSAHVLLLVSHQIDTNHDFLRIVCDHWLEMQFPSFEESQNFISEAIRVRDLWNDVLHKVFEECFDNFDRDNDYPTRSPELRNMQTQLTKSIYKFLCTEVLHSVKRLLPADLSHLYIGGESISKDNQILNKILKNKHHKYTPNTTKGGVQYNSYLTYNCLENTDDTKVKFIKKLWVCPHCNKEMVLSLLEQFRHREECYSVEQEIEDTNDDHTEMETSSKPKAYDPLSILYSCPECKEQLLLTATEIIKHKRSHNVDSSNISKTD